MSSFILYANTAQTHDFLIREPREDDDLSARTVTWEIKPTTGGAAIASGNAEFVDDEVILGVTYYRFRVSLTDEQAALMTAGTEYELSLSESVSKANARPKSKARTYRGN